MMSKIHNEKMDRPLPSSILYRNNDQDLLILDVPLSLSLAQLLPRAFIDDTTKEASLIYSSEALQSPFSETSEPKTESGRAKVLGLLSKEEHIYRESLISIVQDGVENLRARYQGRWCHPRNLIPINDKLDVELPLKKRLQLSEPDLSPKSALSQGNEIAETISKSPPIILSPGPNIFSSIDDIWHALVKNPNSQQAIIHILTTDTTPKNEKIYLRIPPNAAFVLTTIQPPISYLANPLPLIPCHQRFDFILADPPWPNRSVKRSKHYSTSTLTFDELKELIGGIIRNFRAATGVVGIWVTNSGKARSAVRNAFQTAGISVVEEWVWLKTTVMGEAVTPIDGIWRKPYEVLMVGKATGYGPDIRRRVIAGVPDLHSRKPGLRDLIGDVIFEGKEYTGLEVFARSLTAGWWAIGDEVVRFNWEGWWSD